VISRQELQNLTRLTGFDLWQTEKDYLQHLFLFFLSKEMKRELVFKGGTALQKIYGLNRFSIDLDFTSTNDEDGEIVKKVSKNMSDFGFDTKISKTEKFRELSKTIAFKINGPLYDGTEKTLTTLRVEISLRKDLILEPEVKETVPIYPDVKPYLILVMRLEEIAAEKIRAILWRSKARDVYDLWFLIKKKVAVDFNLINKKLNYYDMKFDLEEFKKRLEEAKISWEGDLLQILTFVPEFEGVRKEIIEKIKST